jgi:hypothetical protein
MMSQSPAGPLQRVDNNEGLLLLAYRSSSSILTVSPHPPQSGGDPLRFYTLQHQFYCGIDLHVDWMSLGGIDADGEVRVYTNIRTDPTAFLQALQPFRGDVVGGVECLFPWDLAR